MKKDVAIKLKEKIKEALINFSRPDREFNYTNETFKHFKTIVLSESTAIEIAEKNTGKRAVFLFYYINGGGGKWCYLVPTDSHVLGMMNVSKYLQKIEEYNFDFNE